MIIRMKNITRRRFIKTGAAASVGLSLYPDMAKGSDIEAEKVKIAIIGTGNRGTSLLRNLLFLNHVEITAVCDLDESRARNAAGICEKNGKFLTSNHIKGLTEFKTLCYAPDIPLGENRRQDSSPTCIRGLIYSWITVNLVRELALANSLFFIKQCQFDFVLTSFSLILAKFMLLFIYV